MNIPDTAWVRKPQEREGDYWFSGQFVCTQGVRALVNLDEIMFIYLEIQDLVRQNNGLDYLQVYERKLDNEKLFFIDQLTKSQVESGEFKAEYNYCTLMFAHEY